MIVKLYFFEDLQKCGWANKEIFEKLIKININDIYPDKSKLDSFNDYPTLALNAVECQYFKMIAESAAHCSGDLEVVNRFKSFYKMQIKGDRKDLFMIASSFYYRYYLVIDKAWAKNVVLEDFRKSNYEAILALCVCCGIGYVDKEVAEFVTKNEVINKVIVLIEEDNDNKRFASWFISYVIATKYFGYFDEEKYDSFLSQIPIEHLGKVYMAILNNISDGEDGYDSRLQLLRETHKRLYSIHGTNANDMLISSIRCQDVLNSDSWEIIESVKSDVTGDYSLWCDIELCLEKTASSNEHITKVINAIAEKLESSMKGMDYFVDRVLFNLARLGEKELVSVIAKAAMKTISPTKYKDYVESPENALKDFDNHNLQ